MSIDSSGSVGIGTTSPDARLEVLTTTTNKFVRFRADNNEQRFEFYVGASGNASRMSMHNDAATETIRFASAGNSYFNGGSVGIGTTSPSSNSKLEVIGKGDQLGSTGFYINSSFKDDANVGVFICHDDTVNTTGAIAGINQLSFITYGGTSPLKKLESQQVVERE